MSDSPVPAPIPSHDMHRFQIAKQPGGQYIHIFRRVDIRRVDQVAVICLYEEKADGNQIGERVCELLDHELATRAREPNRP